MMPADVYLVTVRYQIPVLELAARWVPGIAIIAAVTLQGHAILRRRSYF